MAASMGQCSMFLVALFPFLVYGSEPRASLEGVVYALERLVGYYKNNYKQINLDGLYGLRTLEGQFMLLDAERERGLLNHIPLSVLSRIKAMELQTAKICKDAIEFVRKDDEKYFEQMRYIIEKPWMIFKQEKKINEKLRWDPKHYKKTLDKAIEEDTSDKCMMELFGTANIPKCSISSKCAEIMTRKGQMEYSITHQVLWSLLAEQVGCMAELNKVLLWFNFKNAEEMHIEFCSNNFFEMKHLVHSYLSGVIPPFYQDLFLEQQFVCPSIGFSEFLHLNYLKQLLSWMKPSGCYGRMPALEVKNISTFYTNMKVEDYYDQSSNKQKLTKKDVKRTLFPLTVTKANEKPNIPFLPEQSLRESASKIQSPKISSPVVAVSLIKSLSNRPQDPFVQQILAKSLRKNHARLHPTETGFVKSMAANKVEVAPLIIQPNLTGLVVNVTRLKNKPPPLIMDINRGESYVHQDGIKNNRKLLVEKELKDGCLIHKTAVAAGTLAVYLNFLLHHTLDQLNHSDNAWHSVSQRLLLHAASKTVSDVQLVKKTKLPFPLERKDMDLRIPDQVVEREVAVKVGVQEPILGDAGLGLVSNRKDDAGEDNDYDEYEDDKFPGENYHDKKVVHFGNKESLKSLDENTEDYDNESLDEDEDGDYTYYDENDEGLEKQERIKQKKYFQNTGIEKKQMIAKIPDNSAFQRRSAHEGHESFSDSSSPTGIVLVTVMFTLVLLLLLMYRFIKKRRIHIRYNPTSFLKL